MSLDLFLVLMMPFFFYGAVSKAKKNSKTTAIVIVGVFCISVSAKFVNSEIILLETYLFMLFLFARAALRPYVKSINNRWIKRIFYA